MLGRHFDCRAVQQLLDGQDLQAREAAPEFRLIVARAEGLLLHRARRWLEGDEDADGGTPLQQAAQVADVGAADFAGLDLHDDLLRAFVLVEEVDEAVNAAVGAFLSSATAARRAEGTGAD